VYLGEKEGYHGEVRNLRKDNNFRAQSPVVEEIDAARFPPQPSQGHGVGKRAQGTEDRVRALPAHYGQDRLTRFGRQSLAKNTA